MERFSPQVHIPARYVRGLGVVEGYDYTPEGWEWILAFALQGCEWAIREADKPGFREHIQACLRERKRNSLKACIEEKLDEIERLRKGLRLLDEPST